MIYTQFIKQVQKHIKDFDREYLEDICFYRECKSGQMFYIAGDNDEKLTFKYVDYGLIHLSVEY